MTRVGNVSRVLGIVMLAAALWPSAAWAADPPLVKPLTAVSFSSANNGFISGGTGSDGVVSWTKDGGASWHATVDEKHMRNVTASVDGLAATVVPATYDGLLNVTNSGVAGTWESPLHGRTVDYADMAHLSGGRRVAVGKLSDQYAFIASAVGSGDWQIDFQGPYYAPPNDEDPAPSTRAYLSAIDAAPGATTAWTVGVDWTESNTPPYKGLIYKTSDSGSTWTTQTAPTTTSGLDCVAAPSSQVAFIGQQNSTKVWRTLDGSTWAEVTALPSAWSIGGVNGIDALDTDRVVVVGNSGRVAWTSNASAVTPTWTSSTAAPANVTLLGVQMLDADSWIVVGDKETIRRTDDGGATWTGTSAETAPTLAITSPSAAHLLDSATLSIEGTSSDGRGIGVAGVEVRIEKSGPAYWNGSAWVASSDTWLPAAVDDASDGWDTWSASVTIPDTSSVGTLKVWARASDGFGLKSTQYAWVTSTGESPVATTTVTASKTSMTIAYGGTATLSGTLTSGGSPVAGKTIAILPSSKGTTTTTDASGNFSFSASPSVKTTYTLQYAGEGEYEGSSAQVVVTPYAKVTTPVVPSSIKHTKSFKAYTYLYPKHTAGTTAMTFYFQKKNSKGTYVTVKTVTAKAADYSSARSKVTSPSVKLKAGKWRVRAKHVDAGHATTYSARKYFTVK